MFIKFFTFQIKYIHYWSEKKWINYKLINRIKWSLNDIAYVWHHVTLAIKYIDENSDKKYVLDH